MRRGVIPDGYLTREEVARAVGRTKSTIRRWEQSGKLKPTINEDGTNLFREEDVRRLNGGAPIETLPKARAYVASAERIDGELAAKVFDLLEEGATPVAIVQRLRIHPDVLEGLLARWARLRKGFFIDGMQAAAILRMLGIQSEPERAEQFAGAVRSFASQYLRCHDCKRAWPTYCPGCAQRRGKYSAMPHDIEHPATRSSNAQVPTSTSNAAIERENACDATIVVITIPSFSEHRERMTKADCMQLLVDFSAATARIAGMNGAVVDDQAFDVIAAVFRSQQSCDEHARRAVHVALQICNALQKLNDRLRDEGLPLVEIEIAIDTFASDVTGGNAVSDVVRKAGASLARAIKQYGPGIFATEASASAITKEFETQRRDALVVEGRSEPVVIYELVGVARATRDKTTATI